MARLPLSILVSALPAATPGQPLKATRASIVRLFGSLCHHIYRYIFAAKFAVVEHHAAFGKRKQGVVLANTHIAARIDLGAALTHDNVATDDGFAAEFLHAKATTG